MAVAQQYSENLGGGQEWMETGGGGGFDQLYLSLLQQQQQMMIIQSQQRNHNNQNLGFDCSGDQVVSTSSNHHISSSMAFSQSPLAQVENQQRNDFDRFIDLQYERLRLALHEQRKQQVGVLFNSFESKVMSLLRQKDEQLTEVTRKSSELEECLRQTEMENQAWQRIAKENEAMVISLNKTLEQVRENACFSSSAAEDAGSCCDFFHHQESSKNEEEKKMVCKSCNSRDLCTLFLPCRHLCSCKFCEAFLDFCPICKSVKKSSIEVNMS